MSDNKNLHDSGSMRMTGQRERTLVALNKNRIFILFGVVFIIMAVFAPRFLTVYNLTSIMRTVAMNATAAIGFTIILIVAQLDLSIGTIITFSGVVGIGLYKYIGYGGSIPIAIAAGCIIGLINGVLVAKAKISSFIVTLGMMTILQGAIYTLTGGNTISLTTDEAFNVADVLSKMLIPLITPRVIITIVLVAAFAVFLRFTKTGRNLYMVGGNKQTAWLAESIPIGIRSSLSLFPDLPHPSAEFSFPWKVPLPPSISATPL